ncbi:hypothetical protein glysoja_017821 [Glycine soja]|nr:hypothetical protein glysoja_017821 [Glycine soja]
MSKTNWREKKPLKKFRERASSDKSSCKSCVVGDPLKAMLREDI